MKGDSEPTKILGVPRERLPAYPSVLSANLATAAERRSQSLAIAVVQKAAMTGRYRKL